MNLVAPAQDLTRVFFSRKTGQVLILGQKSGQMSECSPDVKMYSRYVGVRGKDEKRIPETRRIRKMNPVGKMGSLK